MSRRCVIAAAAVVAAGNCLAASPTPDVDPICPAIVAFANATPEGRAHSITIFSQLRYEEQDEGGSPLNSRRCEDDATQEGAALCEAVLRNVSYEFPLAAGTRAVACLGGKPYEAPQGATALLSFDIAVRTFEMKGVRSGTRVDAEYRTIDGATSRVGVFRVFASRKKPD